MRVRYRSSCLCLLFSHSLFFSFVILWNDRIRINRNNHARVIREQNAHLCSSVDAFLAWSLAFLGIKCKYINRLEMNRDSRRAVIHSMIDFADIINIIDRYYLDLTIFVLRVLETLEIIQQLDSDTSRQWNLFISRFRTNIHSLLARSFSEHDYQSFSSIRIGS